MRTLTALLALAFALPAAPASPALARPTAGFRQLTERIAPHVHLLRQDGTYFYDPVGNVVVIEQSDGVVLVDSGGSFGSGRRIAEAVRAISRKPVKAVILTHYHSDHSLGVAAIRAAWPRVEIIAQRETLALMRQGRPPGVPRSRSVAFEVRRARSMTATFAEIRAQAGQAESAAERAGWARELDTLPLRLADLRGTHTILPTRTFTDRLVLPDPVTPIEILHFGRANTPGDALVWIPSAGVLATGDILVEPISFMFDVFPSEMLQVLARMRGLDFQLLIPGHGAAQGRFALDRLESLVREVQRQVTPLARAGVPLEQVVARTDFAAQRALYTEADPWLRSWFEGYALMPLVESVYHEARGDRLGPPLVQRP